MKYLDKTIQEIHSLLKEKKIKPIDLVEECFERIEKNKDLNAYITLNKEEAIKTAKELENKEVDNLLFGLPIAVKDKIVTNGLRTTCASHILDNFIPIYDATVVEKIKKNNTNIEFNGDMSGRKDEVLEFVEKPKTLYLIKKNYK